MQLLVFSHLTQSLIEILMDNLSLWHPQYEPESLHPRQDYMCRLSTMPWTIAFHVDKMMRKWFSQQCYKLPKIIWISYSWEIIQSSLRFTIRNYGYFNKEFTWSTYAFFGHTHLGKYTSLIGLCLFCRHQERWTSF